jgi:4-hydroxy-tetrahydrodipicolinate reductase
MTWRDMRTADQPTRITLIAPDGRMGIAITSAVAADARFVIDQEHGDVLIDFSAPAALEASLARATGSKVPILVGTTGLQPAHRAMIEQAAHEVAVIQADAPSGTALLLGQAAAQGRGSTLEELGRFDRISEHPHGREPGTIGFASLRGGSVAGEHVVILAAEGERIELGHRADSRMIFARGALAAAAFLAGKPAGLYSMRDVIGA